MDLRTYALTIEWQNRFNTINVQCRDDDEALRTAYAVIRHRERDRAEGAKATVHAAGFREVGAVHQEGTRVLTKHGAEYQQAEG